MGVDLAKMIQLYSKGLEFSSTKDAYELDYGLVEVPFGRVNSHFLSFGHRRLIMIFLRQIHFESEQFRLYAIMG